MASGPIFDHFTVGSGISSKTGPVFDHFAEKVTSTKTGPIFDHDAIDLFFGLINNKQITQNTIAADRLVDIPIQVLSSRFSVDMTQTLISELFIVPSGQTCIILGILFEATAATSVTTPPTISLGIAAGENDIFDDESMVNFDTTGETWSNWLIFSHARAAASSEAIKINTTGAAASQLVGDIHLVGFLV